MKTRLLRKIKRQFKIVYYHHRRAAGIECKKPYILTMNILDYRTHPFNFSIKTSNERIALNAAKEYILEHLRNKYSKLGKGGRLRKKQLELNNIKKQLWP